jgi:hypothetical protein
MVTFDKLGTVQFQKAMRSHAVAIYQRLFPGCVVVDLRENGVDVHVLDKEFGVDTLVLLPSGQWISVQEKYRNHEFLVNERLQVLRGVPDFTQEYKNAYGTPTESDGEWFKLGAQLYFYGWANSDASGFEKWVLLDIAKYKMLIESLGGLDAVGEPKMNYKHGRAMFYAIPVTRLRDAFVTTYAQYP